MPMRKFPNSIAIMIRHTSIGSDCSPCWCLIVPTRTAVLSRGRRLAPAVASFAARTRNRPEIKGLTCSGHCMGHRQPQVEDCMKGRARQDRERERERERQSERGNPSPTEREREREKKTGRERGREQRLRGVSRNMTSLLSLVDVAGWLGRGRDTGPLGYG